jgi:hypothetical protein
MSRRPGTAFVVDRSTVGWQFTERRNLNHDGDHSAKEFIEDGRYMTRQARQGIFNASDAKMVHNVQ